MRLLSLWPDPCLPHVAASMEDRQGEMGVEGADSCIHRVSIPSLKFLKMGQGSTVSPYPSAVRDCITWKGPLAFLQSLWRRLAWPPMEAVNLEPGEKAGEEVWVPSWVPVVRGPLGKGGLLPSHHPQCHRPGAAHSARPACGLRAVAQAHGSVRDCG